MQDDWLRLSHWKQGQGELDFKYPDRWPAGQHFHRYPQDHPITADDILHGWRPPVKLITQDTKVLAFGSCFAEYFIRFLAEHEYNRWQLPVERHTMCEE